LGSSELILRDDLPDAIVETALPESGERTGFHELVKEAKKQVIIKALEQAGGNYVEAAKLLHLYPSNLHRLIRNLNLKSELPH
jgi:transcriptional regulator with GAF, ATPase, and Fis domain